MTRKISGHDGDLVVTSDVELDGQITGGLVVEPGGSAVVRGSLVGTTLSVGRDPAAESGELPDDIHRDIDDVIGEIP